MGAVYDTYVYTTDEDGKEVFSGQFEDTASANAWIKTQDPSKKFEVSPVRPRDRKAKP